MRKHFLLSLLTLPIFNLLAQDINVKVKESTFEDKPAIEKEAQFEPANFFLMGGVGMGYRTGNVIARFRANGAQQQDQNSFPRTTTENNKFKFGIVFEVGGSYYFDNNFGIGLRGSLFHNNIDFIEGGELPGKPNNPANAKTEIYSGLLEGLYRIHFSKEEKTGFFYGGIGIGATSIDQKQKYTAGRKTTVSESTLAIRPSAGVNVPLYDRFHFYSEVGFLIGNKKTDGNLSLSQFQLTAGVQIRLNSF